MVYRMQVLQEIVNKAETNGHNTVILTTGSEGPTSLIPIVNNKTITQVVKEPPADAAAVKK